MILHDALCSRGWFMLIFVSFFKPGKPLVLARTSKIVIFHDVLCIRGWFLVISVRFLETEKPLGLALGRVLSTCFELQNIDFFETPHASKTLTYLSKMQNKLFVTSRCARRVRLDFFYRTLIVSSNLTGRVASCEHLKF